MIPFSWQKRLRAAMGYALSLGLTAGCQGSGNFPVELSTVTPQAILKINALSARLDAALQAAAGNASAVTSLQAARSLIGVPQQFLVAFSAKATTISRSHSGFNLTYTSDDLFTPLATWRVTISGGQFGSSPRTLVEGHISADGGIGDYASNLPQLGDNYQVVWTTASDGTLSFKVTVADRSTTIVIRPDNHGSVSTSTATTNF